METRHKVFISYHHANDQRYKEELLRLNELSQIFIDASVDTGDIDDELDDQTIRETVRDDYLSDSSVTLLLVGTETRKRKHVDWELYSSMFDGAVNKKSGILVVNLPTIFCEHYTASHVGEKQQIYPEIASWISIDRAEYERRYPYMPDRIIDNLVASGVKTSVINWNRVIQNIENLRFLIDQTFNARASCNYDLSRAMRRANS